MGHPGGAARGRRKIAGASRRAASLALALSLAGCAQTVDLIQSFSPPPPPPPPEPEPAYRQLISEHFTEIFPSRASLRNISLSPVRRAQLLEGSGWRVCLQADVTGQAGQEIGTQMFVVTFQRNMISDRRRAVPEDDCQNESFEKFPLGVAAR